MGNFLSSNTEAHSAPEPSRFLMVGLDGAGKTTILYRMKHRGENIVTTIHTIGFNLETINNHGTIFTAWDVGGRVKIRPMFRAYYKLFDAGIIFVVDSSDMDRINQAKFELFSIINDELLHGRPLLVLCNKQDLPGAVSPSKISMLLGLDTAKACEDRKWNAIGCSATKTSDIGLYEGLDWLSRSLLEESEKDGDSVTLPSELSISSDEETEIDIGYNPTYAGGNITLAHFRPIKNSTECPFSRSATLWGGYQSTEAGSTVEEQAEANVAALTEFVHRSDSGEQLDGFCIELNDPMVSKGGPKELGEGVLRMLMALSDHDPAGEAMMRVNFIGARGWRFRFNKADFFVTTFAPCYPPTSSRYAFGTGKAFILLQPMTSFASHGLPPDSPTTNWDAPKSIRDKTRVAFRRAGREYYIPETTRYPPAEHIVKPLHDDGSSVVKWWNE